MSLMQEFQGKDANYINTRIRNELDQMTMTDRNQFWSSYNAQVVAFQDDHSKHSFLVHLLDSFLIRNKKQGYHHQVPAYAVPTPSTPAPISTTTPPPSTTTNNPGNKPVQTTAKDPVKETSIPKYISDYHLKKTIGQGTFGKVKLGEHIHTKQQVAIKVIEKSNVKTHKQRNSVQREVRLMKLLQHPHIVQVLDIIENHEHIYIIMEYAAGGELFDYIVSHGMVKEKEARAFFRQILSAVNYCHQHSIIHRDLKPENLLLDSNKNIKIIDFGFGNTFHRERTLDTYCGSPFYAAPEMIKGVRYVGPEVDVWSLGVILFALLSGRLPFDASTMSELYDRISKGVYVTPSHFSPEASHLISRMLTVDPRQRATLEEVIQHEWTNTSFSERLPEYMNPRPQIVLEPHHESIAELVSYGIAESEIKKLLAHPVGLHPITSLYHLVEEARLRKLITERESPMTMTLKKQQMQQDSTTTLISPEQEDEVMMTEKPASSTTPTNIDNTTTTNTTGANTKSKKRAIYRIARPRVRPSSACLTSPPANNMAMNAQQTQKQSQQQQLQSIGAGAPGSMKRPSTAMAVDHPSNIPQPTRHHSVMTQLPGTRSSVTSTSSNSSSTNDTYSTDSTSSPSSPSSTPSKQTVRTVKGFFNVSTTSSKPSTFILSEVRRVLLTNNIQFNPTPTPEPTFVCTTGSGSNVFEIELVKVPNLDLFGLNLKRVKGSVWSHKKLCNKLVEQMHL